MGILLYMIMLSLYNIELCFFVNFRSVVHNPKFVFVQVQLISNSFVIALFYFLLNIKSCKWEIKERREGPELHRN